MADTQTTVTTLDIQMLDADRGDATTIKLDNPKDNVTREQVSSAMQPAFTNGWFLTNKGSVAMYLGDVTLNQSIKTKLGGEDFYVTPTSLAFSQPAGGSFPYQKVSVSGATIQGYNFANKSSNKIKPDANVIDNGLSIMVAASASAATADMNGTFDLELIIQGEKVTIPCTITVT